MPQITILQNWIIFSICLFFLNVQTCDSWTTAPGWLWRDGLYLVSLLAAGDGTGERLLLAAVHAHGAEDGLRADGAFCGPRFIAVRLLIVYLLLVILAAWGETRRTRNMLVIGW